MGIGLIERPREQGNREPPLVHMRALRQVGELARIGGLKGYFYVTSGLSHRA